MNSEWVLTIIAAAGGVFSLAATIFGEAIRGLMEQAARFAASIIGHDRRRPRL
jgi:hypothetical protein